jgi:hypothetical protein
VKVLSRVFRGKFCAGLKRLHRRQQLRCTGPASALADPKQVRQLLRRLHRQDWVIYAKPAFGGPMKVLRYLGRYTHRIAISNQRLLAFDGERVTFRWKDYEHGGKQRKMTLLPPSFCDASSYTCYRRASSESFILASWRIDSALTASHFVSNYWRAIARHHRVPPKRLPIGIARTAEPLWWSSKDSPPWSSRCAPTSILHNATFISGLSTCLPHANAFVCTVHNRRSFGSSWSGPRS